MGSLTGIAMGSVTFENKFLKGKVSHTIVSGHLAYQNGLFYEDKKGERLLFEG